MAVSGVDMANGARIRDALNNIVGCETRERISRLVGEIESLSKMERLLLYMQLPQANAPSDPLRQPINPLGSRSEIGLTITWIRAHLEEDAHVSMPKHEVYDEYTEYCNKNGLKALSTADFGKVMKQVYPQVRPRRLGTRGNSRYCYAGLKKRVKMEPPFTPDIGNNGDDANMVVVGNNENDNGDLLASNNAVRIGDNGLRADFSSGNGPGLGEECDNDDGNGKRGAALLLVLEWASHLFKERIASVPQLAFFLVDKMYVDRRSEAVKRLLNSKGLAASARPKVEEGMVKRKGANNGEGVVLAEGEGSGGKRLKSEPNGALQFIKSPSQSLAEMSLLTDPSMDSKPKFTTEPLLSVAKKEVIASVEDELNEYFGEQMVTDTNEDASKNDKLCQLRKLLEKNLVNKPSSAFRPTTPQRQSTVAMTATTKTSSYETCKTSIELFADNNSGLLVNNEFTNSNLNDSASIVDNSNSVIGNISVVSVNSNENSNSGNNNGIIVDARNSTPCSSGNINNSNAMSSSLGGNNSVSLLSRRKVSFNPLVVHSNAGTTEHVNSLSGGLMGQETRGRKRHFSFQPISPRQTSLPQSPTSASPFISPRSTPVPTQLRSRHSSGSALLPLHLLPNQQGRHLSGNSGCSDISRAATFGSISECSTPFISPHSTPIPFGNNRSRHNSAQGRLCNRSRHSSGIYSRYNMANFSPMALNNLNNPYSPQPGTPCLGQNSNFGDGSDNGNNSFVIGQHQQQQQQHPLGVEAMEGIVVNNDASNDGHLLMQTDQQHEQIQHHAQQQLEQQQPIRSRHCSAESEPALSSLLLSSSSLSLSSSMMTERQRHASAGHTMANKEQSHEWIDELVSQKNEEDSNVISNVGGNVLPDDLDIALSALKDCDNDFSKFVEEEDKK